MHSHSRRSKGRRRFVREHGVQIFIGLIIVGVVGLVALLMYAMGTPVLSSR